MWQVLADELEGFTVVSVALDADPDAAAALVRKYGPTYPVLIDARHEVAELYGMVNVPSAAWIDEEGRIARPTHIAGAGEAWRDETDRETSRLSDEGRAALLETRMAYMDAVRAWVREGAYELREPLPDAGESPLALAHFRLATYLHERGLDGAHHHFEEAVRLRPASWNFRRQALALERPGDAAEQFWTAVDATPPGAYYPPAL